jgi:hypothetical protein
VESHLLGSPEEDSSTVSRRVIVKLTRSLQSSWRLSDEDAEKVSFEFAKRALPTNVAQGTHLADLSLDLHSSTQPKDCPYNPNKIALTPGASFEIEVRKPLGFRRS